MFDDDDLKAKRASTIAGMAAGEYLESIGKISLADLTPEEWRTFCEVMCCNYHNEYILA